MKKLFTLFAAALVGVSAFAFTEGNTKISIQGKHDQPVANTEVQLNLFNSNDDLNSIQLSILPKNDAQFKMTMDEDENEHYIWLNGAYLLTNWEGKSDNWKNKNVYANMMFGESIKDGALTLLMNMNKTECYTYPAADGIIGYFVMDLSAVPDGEGVEIARIENAFAKSSFGDTSAKGYNIVDEANQVAEDGYMITVDKAGDVVSAINVVETSKNVASVKYFNLQGIESATPFNGVNIMVKTYEDGSKSTTKVVK